jgi:DNA polymerase-3 subunit delta
MSPEDLFDELERGTIGPIYYLYGEETFLIDEAIEKIRAKLVPSPATSLNYHVFYGGDVSGADIFATAKTPPFMDEARFILVRQAHAMPSRQWEPLKDYFLNPLPSTCLAFVGDKLPLRGALASALREGGRVATFKHPYGKGVDLWIKRLAARKKKKIDHKAVPILKDWVGNDLTALSSALENLALFIGEREVIKSGDVEEVTSDIRIESATRVMDSIMGGELEAALREVRKLLDDGEPPLRLVGLIASHVRQMSKAKEMLAAGASAQAIGEACGVRQYRLGAFMKHARTFSLDMTERYFYCVMRTDLALKSSRVPKAILIDRLVVDLCELAGSSRPTRSPQGH